MTIEQERLEEYSANFRKEMKEFARKGDARDTIPSYEEELKVLRSKVKDKELLSRIDEEIRYQEKVCDLADSHSVNMARHESGSGYYKNYSELLEEIGL